MEGFRTRYLRACDEANILASDFVLQNLRERIGNEKGQGRLDLSGCSFTVEDCHAISKALATDMFFIDLRLADCLLTEEACLLILNVLAGNRSIKKLDLKGNNIRCRGADAVGKILKRTMSLTHVRLEWNSLGMWDSCIHSIAEGLSLNQTLKFLDLRNNQISHEGATALAGALKRNRALRTLDMRWNNVGIIGGRAFLSALNHNHVLTKLELGGNNIPGDVLKAVEAAVQKNGDRAAVYAEQEAVMSIVQQELTMLEQEKKRQVSSLVDHLAKEKEVHQKFTKSADEKIAQLKEALDSLAVQHSTCEANLRKSEQQNRELSGTVEQLKQEQKRKEESYEMSLRILKDQLASLQVAHEEERTKLQKKIHDREKAQAECQSELVNVQEELETMRKTARKAETAHLEDMRELETRYKREVDALHVLYDDQKATCEERIRRLESETARLHEEVSRLKTAAQADKLSFEEEKLNMTNRWKQEELQRTKQYEERLTLLQNTKEELHVKCTRQTSEITESITQIARLNKELETVKYQNAQLRSDLSAREQELVSQTTEFRREQGATRERNTKLEADLSDLRRRAKETEEHKNAEIARLQSQLDVRQSDISRMREEELRRASMLENAFHSYIASTKSPYKG